MKDFLDGLTDDEAAEVIAAMKEVAREGLVEARHLKGDIYEVRADAETQSFRILFSTEGRFNHVLLGLLGFSKKSQKTPVRMIELAQDRLRDWRARGRLRKKGKKAL